MINDDRFDADFIVVGSGFGGAVSALRLVEKGYSVIVLEAGKRWRTEDFPRTNWSFRKYLWAPQLRCFGIQRITWLPDVLVLSGTGVGGGSLVYANTLLVPSPRFFEDPQWRDLADWRAELAPKYEVAMRMLGATELDAEGEKAAMALGEGDHVLADIARDMGRSSRVHRARVGVFFGEPGVRTEDPYFDGAGPARTGCTFCGGCMVGCRVGAKNTLDKNYLHLAEQRGARVVATTTVDALQPLEGGGYLLETHDTTALWKRATRKRWRARNVVLSGGVLGTVPLLLQCRARGLLPKLSHRLGRLVRTNSEVIVGATARHNARDFSRGLAISSGFYPDDETHIEAVRYGRGQDAMSLLATLMTDVDERTHRWWSFVRTILRHPIDFVRSLVPLGWAKRTMILLVMQARDNRMSLALQRKGLVRRKETLTSRLDPTAEPIPTRLPIANEVSHRAASKIDGYASACIHDALLGVPLTAHILGGCCIGRNAEDGVIGPSHEVFGYPGLYVVDGSAIPANLGVNPALTITAMAERAMDRIPARL